MKAEEFKTLKGKIDTEIKKRCLNHSDTEQGVDFGSLRELTKSMEFTKPVEAGRPILAEHGEKTINFLYEIKDPEGLDYVVKNGLLPQKQSMLTLDEFLNTLSNEVMEGQTSSCRGACTGLCFGSCIGVCNGCSGTCTGDCSGCSANCGSGCANSSMYA